MKERRAATRLDKVEGAVPVSFRSANLDLRLELKSSTLTFNHQKYIQREITHFSNMRFSGK